MTKKKTKIDIFIPNTPVSTQHAYINKAISRNKMIRFLSKKAKDFKEEVINTFHNTYPGYEDKTFFGDIDLEVEVYLQFKTKRKTDWDNYHKLWCDALEGLAYNDDTQIKKATVYKGYDKENPGIRIIIRPL